MPAISQEEWDRRAAAVNATWLEPVKSARTKTQIACLGCGREWSARPYHVQAGHGCGPCSWSKSAEDRRLSTEEIVARAENIGCEWVTVPKTAREVQELRCLECGFPSKAAPDTIKSRTQCAVCSGRYVPAEAWIQRADERNLEFVDPVGFYLDPHRLRCLICDEVTEFTDLLSLKRSLGCPICVKEERLRKRRIPQEVWDQVAADRKVKWLEPVENGFNPTSALCLVCNTEWPANPHNMKGRETSGCPTCADYGFDPSSPAILYLLIKPVSKTMKIGITTAANNLRLSYFRNQQNYEVIKTWSFELGADARKIEREVLSWWRKDLGLDPHEASGVSGWTETVNALLVSPEETIEFVASHSEELVSGSTTLRKKQLEFDF